MKNVVKAPFLINCNLNTNNTNNDEVLFKIECVIQEIFSTNPS